MAKILGLDLGTNSLGWAIVENEYEDKKELFALKDKGVIIFSEGVKIEKGNEKSRAAERTAFRSARKLKFRRKLRKYETLLVLAKNGMCPLTENEVKAWRKSNFKKYPLNEEFLNWLKTDDKINKNPYALRDKASRTKINKLDLGRAFYHIAQRRGFLSNRLDQSDKGIIELHKPNLLDILAESNTITALIISINAYFESIEIANKKKKDLDAGQQKLLTLYNDFKFILKEKEDLQTLKDKIKVRLNKKENLGAVAKGITELDEKMKGFKTLGQYFNTIYGKSNQKIRGQYTAREDHYLKEFEVISRVQGLGKIIETEKETNKKYKGIVLDLYKAIFYQRPLKSQKGLVGKCTLEPTKYRCPVSRPEFEEYRMYQYLNNFKIKTPNDEKLRALTKDEKEKVKPLFFRKKVSFDFEDVVKKLIPKGEKAVYFKSKESSSARYVVNYKLNTSLSNCPTIFHLKNVFGEDWKSLHYTYKTTDKKGIAQTRTIEYQDIWHIWTTFTSEDKLYEFAKNRLQLEDKEATKFAKVNLKKDYAALSLKAINNILPYLKKGLIYSHAVFMANMKNVVKAENWNNEAERKIIQTEIKNIIDNHQLENRFLYVMNGCIHNNFKNSYSQKADDIYRKELNEAFEKEFGKKKWQALNVNNLFESKYQLFVAKFKEKAYFKIKRIDEKVLEFLDDNDLLKDKNKLYHPADIEKFRTVKETNKDGELLEVLGSSLSNSIKNPMAMKVLHKVRKLINTLILEGKIDKKTKIHIELARELNDANKRKAIQKWQKDKEEEYKVYRKKIIELYEKETNRTDFEPNTADVLKYKLWEEQQHICLYTGKTISLTDFLSENPNYDIEHTIPRSVSVDDSQMNKTLCENEFNRKIKKNQIPSELNNHNEILTRISHWKTKYEKLDNEIKGLVRASKTAVTKDAKDRIIQKRHYLKMERDYWKGKYKRFEIEEVKAGFKNSQLVDTGIITKYAQQYLKSYFDKVYTVKGTMVDQFKQAWGIKKTVTDANGVERKDRTNHIHHCQDAITIACMTKNKYNVLAKAWGLEEKRNFKEAKDKLKNSKPWKTFTEDVKNIQNEVLIVHSHKDKVPVQSKKKLRIRGKIQYIPETKIPKYQQGDTVRGSLHKDTFYGAILEKSKEGKKGFNKDKEGDNIVNYVVRKSLDGIKKTDVDKIVDEAVKGIVIKAIKDKILVPKKDVYKIETEQTVWMNEAKQIPIHKVRVFTPSVKKPLQDFKKHAVKDKSKHPHKRKYHVQNDENYCMAIYEGHNKAGKIKRSSELINMLDASKLLKFKRETNSKDEIVAAFDKKTNYPLKYILTKGKMVLLYENDPNEIWELSDKEKLERLFEITQLDVEGGAGIKLLFHQEAREKKKITAFMGLKSGMKGGKNIGKHEQYPWLKIGHNAFDSLVEDYDFTITTLGKIVKI